MITTQFPPYGGSGVQRLVKFAKYLSRFGWDPIILTVDEKKKQSIYDPSDPSLLEELPKNIKIYRSGYVGFCDLLRFFKRKGKVPSPNRARWVSSEKSVFVSKIKAMTRPFIIPDPQFGWYPFAIWKGKQIFHENSIDMLYSTSPSPTAHLIAMYLAKKSQKPWVADFRDPWTKLHSIKRPFPFNRWERSLEKSVLEKADKIVIAWPAIQDSFMPCDKEQSQKTVLIYNGFDEQDFQGVILKAFSKFTIVHMGTFHKDRTPESLFRAIEALLRDKPTLINDIQIVLVGKDEPFVRDLIEEHNLNDVVLTVPYLPHKECLRHLLGADVLFLNTLQNYVPGKTFEYVRSKKPILALVPNDTTVAEIVNSTQSGVVVDPSETEKIRDTILGMYEQYKKGELKLNRVDDSVIYQYERKNLTGKLAEIFDELTEKN